MTSEHPYNQRVVFIAPETVVYHHNPHCPALRRADRYWPISRGWANDQGQILGDNGRIYKNRRACRRCSP